MAVWWADWEGGSVAGIDYVPELVCDVGPTAAERFVTFFTNNIRNPNTRRAYHRAALQFFDWCQSQRLDFTTIKSFHVSAFLEELLAGGKNKSSVKQSLAAIRMLYDWLIVGQVCQINPAQAVRGPKLVIHKGSTPVLSDDQVRQLFASIDTDTLVGLRDRALIGMMLYTFGRVGAVVAMLVHSVFGAVPRRLY